MSRVRKVRKSIVLNVALLVAALTFSGAADAQRTLLSASAGKKLGVQIKTDSWSDLDETYTDLSYRKLKANQALLINKKIGAFDYYYRLKISVPTSLTNKSIGCSALPFFQTLATNFFGVSDVGSVIVSGTIGYEETVGSIISLVNDKAPMLMVTSGADVGKCLLKETPSVEFPNIRFEDYGNETFLLNFDVSAGSSANSQFVQTLLGLFNLASTAASWNTLTSAQAGFASSIAQKFDNAFLTASSRVSEDPLSASLKQGSMLQIRIPGGFNQSAIEIFPYKSASIIAQGKNLSPASVLANRDLAARSCSLGTTSSGGCAPKTSALMQILLSDTVKQVPLSTGYAIPFTLFEPGLKPDLVYPLCTALRLFLDTELKVSTLDQMLVRWALSKQSGLQSALKDNASRAKMLVDKDGKPILSNGTAITADDLTRQCWNPGDEEVLRAVIVEGMKIKLLDH
jgi:hypothetical protein